MRGFLGIIAVIGLLSWFSGICFGVALGAEGEKRWGQETTQEEKVPEKKESLRVIVNLMIDDCEWQSQSWWTFESKLKCVQGSINNYLKKKDK